MSSNFIEDPEEATHLIPEFNDYSSPSQRLKDSQHQNSGLFTKSTLGVILGLIALIFLILYTDYLFIEEISNNFVKPLLDHRNFTLFKLSNGLRVLAISDKNTLTSAAALEISAGSFHDPLYLQGLAHLVEHLVFLSNDKYPELNGFQNFISLHGGTTNAYTELEYTSYHFQVPSEAFDEALDRFAQFFISPRFSQEALIEELPSIQSEYERTLGNPPHQLFAVLHSISSPTSLYSSFPIGNYDSLRDVPLSLGVNVTESAYEFLRSYYSAKAMTLVVISNKSTEEMKSLVKTTFQDLPSFHIEKPDFKDRTRPFSKGYCGKLAQFSPIDNTLSLVLVFDIISASKHVLSGAVHYINYLLGSRGPGSLFSLLQKKDYATLMDVGSLQPNSQFELYSLAIKLTRKGFQEIEEVIKMCFAEIDLIKKYGVREEIFDSISNMSEIAFHFTREDREPRAEASFLAHNMHVYPTEFIISGDKMLYDYHPESINHFLGQLTPFNMNVIVGSTEFENYIEEKSEEKVEEKFEDLKRLLFENKLMFRALNRFSKDFKLKFSTSILQQSFIESLELVTCEEYPDLKLPGENKFLPQDLSLINECEDKSGKIVPCKNYEKDSEIKKPEKIRDDESMSVWFQMDRSYLTPQIYFTMLLRSSFIYKSPKHYIAAAIYGQISFIALEPILYQISIGGNEILLEFDSIQIHSYSEPFERILKIVLDQYKKFDCSEGEFTLAKDIVRSSFHKQMSGEPYEQLIDKNKFLLLDLGYSPEELLLEVGDFQYETYVSMIQDYMQNLHLDIIFLGNIKKSQAIQYVQTIQNTLNFTGVKREDIIVNRVINIKGRNLVWREVNRIPSSEHGILNSYQSGKITLQDFAHLKLMEYLISNDAYTLLRTEKNLGYIVTCFSSVNSNVLSFNILIQGSVADPNTMDKEIETFLDVMSTKVNALTDDVFEESKAALSVNILANDIDLKEKGERYRSHLLDDTFVFDVKNQLLDVIKNVTHDTFLEYFDKLLKHPSKLSIQIYKNEVEGLPIPSNMLNASDEVCGVPPEILISKEGLKESPRYETGVDFGEAF